MYRGSVVRYFLKREASTATAELLKRFICVLEYVDFALYKLEMRIFLNEKKFEE